MQTQSQAAVIRRAGEGEKYWFFGGGVWTWKTPTDSGDLVVVEVEMEGGKRTPLHTHPIAESMWVLDGEVRYQIDGVEHQVGTGDFVMVPAGVPHAFLVVSGSARVLAVQPSLDCTAFYLGASEPLEGSARQTDFDRIGRSGAENGGITLLGPPPF